MAISALGMGALLAGALRHVGPHAMPLLSLGGHVPARLSAIVLLSIFPLARLGWLIWRSRHGAGSQSVSRSRRRYPHSHWRSAQAIDSLVRPPTHGGSGALRRVPESVIRRHQYQIPRNSGKHWR